jgi:membrane protease YdiL (CAAX protease family)
MPQTRVRPTLFFAVTYLLSWAVWIPLMLSHLGLGPWHIDEGLSSVVRLLGVLMPGTTALLLTAWQGGGREVRRLLSGLSHWRVGGRWWAAAALVQPALVIVIGLLYNALGGQPRVAGEPLSAAVFAIQAFFLLLATLGEEIGWRGVALPGLQQRHGPLAASLVLGLLWAAWHLPFWLLIGNLEEFGPGYLVLNFLLILPGSVYITWFYNHGRGSLLLAVAYHITFNLVNVLWLPVTSTPGAYVWLVAAEWAIAIVLLPYLAPRPRRLTAHAAA